MIFGADGGPFGPFQPAETVLGNGLVSELPGRGRRQGRERAVDPRLDIAVALLLVLAGLEQAIQLVGISGAPGFPRAGRLVLSHGGRDHVRDRGREAGHLVPGHLLIARGGDVVPGQVRNVGDAGLLAVVPQREERRPLRIGALHRGHDRRDHAGAVGMVRDRLGQRNTDL